MRTILSLTIFALAIVGMSCKHDVEHTPAGPRSNTNSNLRERNTFTHRLEFPKVRGGRSIVITHTLPGGEVNYSLEWDGEKKSNRWTCYQLYSSNAEKNVKRWRPGNGEKQYPADPKLPSALAFDTDRYVRSGYDHGHLCPSADRLATLQANRQTFYLSNMQPQVHDFNDGIWELSERFMRGQIIAGSPDTLFLCKGGTIDREEQIKTKLKGGFIVPAYFFCAALLKYRDRGGQWQYKALGLWFDHRANDERNLRKYAVNIDTLESLTGIDFFCNLPDDIERLVESLPQEKVIAVWNLDGASAKTKSKAKSGTSSRAKSISSFIVKSKANSRSKSKAKRKHSRHPSFHF